MVEVSRGGRPRYTVGLARILAELRRCGTVAEAAAAIGVSPAWVHGMLKRAGLTTEEVLKVPGITDLLKRLGLGAEPDGDVGYGGTAP